MASQLPETLNISRARGDTFPFSITLTQNGSPVDITGYTIVMTVNRHQNPPDASRQLFSTTASITDGPNGVATFPMNSAEVIKTSPGTYYLDIQWTDTSSNVRTVAKGEYVIEQDISK